jgi:hypothetical protein
VRSTTERSSVHGAARHHGESRYRKSRCRASRKSLLGQTRRACLKSPSGQSSAGDRFRKLTRAVQPWRQQPIPICPRRRSKLADQTFQNGGKLSFVCAPLVGGGVPLPDLALFRRFGETTGPLRKTRTRSLCLLVDCRPGSAATGTKDRHNCRSWPFVSDSCRCGNAPGERR